MPGSGDTRVASAAFSRWASALIITLLVLLIVSIPIGWVAGYHGRSLTEIYSFVVQDGWCDAATQGVGLHCFGDYYAPVQYIVEGSPWNNAYGVPVAYTATGMLPFALGALAAGSPVGGFPLLIGFLVVAGLATITPALVAAWGRRSWVDRLLIVLLIGVATTPLLTTIDRGSGAAWAVPFLLAFVIWLRRDPWWIAPASLVAAAAVRPQFILAGVALLAMRRFRDLTLAILASAAITLLGFAVWPGGFVQNVESWWRNTGLHYTVRNGDGVIPPSLSVSRVVAVFEEGVLGQVNGVAVTNPSLPGIVLIVLVSAAFAWRGRVIPYPVVVVTALAVTAIVPPLTFAYYGVFVPVIAALVIGGFTVPVGRRAREGVAPMLDTEPPRGRWWGWSALVIGATSLTLALIPIALAMDRRSWVLENVGILWLLVVLWGLAAAVVPGSGRLWAPSGHGPTPHSIPEAPGTEKDFSAD